MACAGDTIEEEVNIEVINIPDKAQEAISNSVKEVTSYINAEEGSENHGNGEKRKPEAASEADKQLVITFRLFNRIKLVLDAYHVLK